MSIPQKAMEAGVQALFDDGCGEPKIDAATVLEAAYRFIEAQALRDAAMVAYNLEDGSVIDVYRSEVADWLTARADDLSTREEA